MLSNVFVQKTNIIPGNLRTSDDDVGPRSGPRLLELPTPTPTHQTTHSHRSDSRIFCKARKFQMQGFNIKYYIGPVLIGASFFTIMFSIEICMRLYHH